MMFKTLIATVLMSTFALSAQGAPTSKALLKKAKHFAHQRIMSDVRHITDRTLQNDPMVGDIIRLIEKNEKNNVVSIDSKVGRKFLKVAYLLTQVEDQRGLKRTLNSKSIAKRWNRVAKNTKKNRSVNRVEVEVIALSLSAAMLIHGDDYLRLAMKQEGFKIKTSPKTVSSLDSAYRVALKSAYKLLGLSA